MSLDQPEKLPNLIRFDLPVHVLQIYQFINSWMDEYVMAPRYPGSLKSKALNESANIVKASIRW